MVLLRGSMVADPLIDALPCPEQQVDALGRAGGNLSCRKHSPCQMQGLVLGQGRPQIRDREDLIEAGVGNQNNVIDAKHGGNAARWINHACTPNCEADEVDGRIFIKALRNIKPDTELFYDYGLIIDEPYTKKLKKQFECRCGTKDCRGTMLAPKRGKR